MGWSGGNGNPSPLMFIVAHIYYFIAIKLLRDSSPTQDSRANSPRTTESCHPRRTQYPPRLLPRSHIHMGSSIAARLSTAHSTTTGAHPLAGLSVCKSSYESHNDAALSPQPSPGRSQSPRPEYYSLFYGSCSICGSAARLQIWLSESST